MQRIGDDKVDIESIQLIGQQRGQRAAYDLFDLARPIQRYHQWSDANAGTAAQQVPADTRNVDRHDIGKRLYGNEAFPIEIKCEWKAKRSCVTFVQCIEAPEYGRRQ